MKYKMSIILSVVLLVGFTQIILGGAPSSQPHPTTVSTNVDPNNSRSPSTPIYLTSDMSPSTCSGCGSYVYEWKYGFSDTGPWYFLSNQANTTTYINDSHETWYFYVTVNCGNENPSSVLDPERVYYTDID